MADIVGAAIARAEALNAARFNKGGNTFVARNSVGSASPGGSYYQSRSAPLQISSGSSFGGSSSFSFGNAKLKGIKLGNFKIPKVRPQPTLQEKLQEKQFDFSKKQGRESRASQKAMQAAQFRSSEQMQRVGVQSSKQMQRASLGSSERMQRVGVQSSKQMQRASLGSSERMQRVGIEGQTRLQQENFQQRSKLQAQAAAETANRIDKDRQAALNFSRQRR